MESDCLSVCVERFIGTKHNHETRTWYAKYLAPMVEFLGAGRPLSSITRAEAERYWQAVQARKTCWENHPTKPTERRPLSPTTLHNHLRAARTFWNAMVRQQLVEFNPFDHLTSPKDTRPVEMKAIAHKDLRALWQAARQSNTRDFAILTVMATTGVRAGELVSMNLRQLDLKQGITWVQGKRGWRKVFLGKAGAQAIQEYLCERPAGQEHALWLNTLGQPLTTDGVRQLVDRLAKQAGIAGRHNLHAFRHRVAQSWLDQGINAQIVAQALGHADVTVTLQIYGNQDDRRVAQAIRQAEMAPFEEPPGLADLELDGVTQRLDRPSS
ncbi:MAG: tyrosine-type recombinase/integrase [Caldilineaceae bacterium]|nr:tyrosine-type recombinase/integrase [Caldilineaceae bacterium]